MLRIPFSQAAHFASMLLDAELTGTAPLSFCIMVDKSVDSELIDALRAALVPQTTSASLSINRIDKGASAFLGATYDLCLILVGTQTEAAYTAAMSAYMAHIPTCLIASSSLDLPELDFVPSDDEVSLHSGIQTIVASSPDFMLSCLAAWLCDATDELKTLAETFPFVRDTMAHNFVLTCAIRNAAVGLINILPSADMPAMTATQLALMIQLADTYQQDLGTAHIVQAAAIVASGFGMRALSRAVTSRVPVGKALVRAGIAFGATMAMGSAMSLYARKPSDFTHQPTALIRI